MNHELIKVTVLTTSISRNAGGLLDAVKDLYLSFSNNFVIRVVSFEDEFSKEDLVQWKHLNVKIFKTSNFFNYSKEFRDYVFNLETDILHVHGLWRYPHFIIREWKIKNNGIVVLSPHGMMDPYILKKQGYFKRFVGIVLFKRAFKLVDCFHALSKAELEAIRFYGVKKPVAKIPNGIAIQSDYVNSKDRDNKRHLLFLARLHPKKGIDLLIEALGELNKENSNLLEDWVVDIVGWADNNYELKLQKLVSEKNLENKVIFHGGLFGVNKDTMYAKASVYILPSHGEGLPLTILEAWSWGLPVIMTEECNIPEGFEYNAALEIKPNVDSIKNSLELYLQFSEDQLSEIGKKGKLLVKTKFLWAEAAKKMEDLYIFLFKSGKKPNFLDE